jgi:hypothetical protein
MKNPSLAISFKGLLYKSCNLKESYLKTKFLSVKRTLDNLGKVKSVEPISIGQTGRKRK